MIRKTLPKAYLLSCLALIAANLLWAAAGPVIKLTTEYMPPFTFLFLRFLIVCILILPFTLISLAKTKIDIKDYWKIFILGVFSQSTIIFVVLGLQYTTAVDSAIIGSLGVLLSMAAGHYFFNEKMNKLIKIGLVIALVGTAVVILEPLLSDGIVDKIPASLRIWGNVLVFLNNLGFLMYIIWSKISFGDRTSMIKKALSWLHLRPMKKSYPGTLLAAISFYVGMITMLPFAIMENLNFFGPVSYDLSALDIKAVLGLLYMALFSSIAAYFLFEWALNTVSVGETAILGYFSSIFALPFAYIILKEIPAVYSAVGGLIIAVGVILAEIGEHRHRNRLRH
jgi:drug/metabolite transporter (DMT)-like permease